MRKVVIKICKVV